MIPYVYKTQKNDDLDKVKIDEYDIKMQKRVKYCRVNYGGIILA